MKKIVLILGLLCYSFLLPAQKNYAVKVADAKTENALVNALVKLKGDKKKGSKTNESGTTVILASPGDVLTVSCTGYKTQEVTMSVSAAVHVFLNKKPEKKKKAVVPVKN